VATSAASESLTPAKAHSEAAISAFAARLALRSAPNSDSSHERVGSTAYDCTIFVSGVYSPSAVASAPICGRYCALTVLRLARACWTRAAATATSRLFANACSTSASSVASPKSSHQRSPTPVVSDEKPAP